jgi:hypothetical protein
MRLNTITLKRYPDDQLIENIRGTYAYVGDRLLWEKITKPMTKKDFLEHRKATEDFSRQNVRWEGEMSTTQPLKKKGEI